MIISQVGSTEFRHFDDNSLTLVAHYPKKNKSVLLLSTLHNDEVIITKSKKPQIIEDYNKTKGGVDTLDKMVSTFTTGRSTKRLPTAAFFCILDIMAVNAYIIFRHFKSRLPLEPIHSKNRREFLYLLGEELVFPQMISRLDHGYYCQD